MPNQKKRKMQKRKREDAEEGMEIVWQTPANPPELQDYIFRNGNQPNHKKRKRKRR
jgi:hypothetical protein